VTSTVESVDSQRAQLPAIWQALLPTSSDIRGARAALHRKSLVIAGLLGTSYYALVVSEFAVPIRALAASVLVVALVALATCVMHDANHGSFSRHRWINRTLAYTADALGASSWLWRVQHNQLHHGNTNVSGYDADLELAPWARLAPSQPWHRRFRWQHVYIWPLYGLLALKNLTVSDALSLVRGRIGQQPLRGPSTGVIARVAAGKLAHVSWALLVPMLFNPWHLVLVWYLACSWLVGFTLAMLFQLAHCVDNAQVATPEAPRRGDQFAAHQLRTTVDIASPMPVAGHVFRWLAGSLDHQIEHHLAPGLPHTIYPRLARQLREACDRHGFEYHLHTGVFAAIRSHARWLRTMGRRPIERSDAPQAG
jgi:linoleoyl-CoA desaturase